MAHNKLGMCLLGLLLAVLAAWATEVKRLDRSRLESSNPFHQNLPDCTENNFKTLKKQTQAKAILCPMIRDEEGFLSEWVAYYQMHGFDHIMIHDDGSTDNGLAELKPWIDSGFVTIKSNWTSESIHIAPAFGKNEFKRMMTTKALLEVYCKLEAVKWGYSYFVSLDIDEYMIPKNPAVTIVDELHNWFEKTKRSIYCIGKLNFQSTPHILEPVNLLTIEAYQTRMKAQAKMNYYTSVAPKCAYRLAGPDYNENSTQYAAKCCHFHGCVGYDFIDKDTTCRDFHKTAFHEKGKPYLDYFDINHYSRSLEKYALKGKTWRTSTGEVKAGENMHDVAKSYDIPKFLHRSAGWHYDSTAVRYGCQLREQLKIMTGNSTYLRPGDCWYRNPEFGKPIDDPDKRGRYGKASRFFTKTGLMDNSMFVLLLAGRHNPPGFLIHDPNPTHYFGGQAFDIKAHALTYGPNEWP
jgi:hypothetical protein